MNGLTIFVFAHPDDESFSSGGTIAGLTKSGVTVKLIVATRGEAGSLGNPPLCRRRDLGKVREQELGAAAKILGISQIYFLGFIDGTLKNRAPSKIGQKILAILQKEKPDVVITFNREGGSRHPDHIQINKAATQAFKSYMKVAKKHVRFYYTAIPQRNLMKYKKAGLDYQAFGKISGTPTPEITTILDTKETFDLKVKALRCHRTQHQDWERFLKRTKVVNLTCEYFRLVCENKFF